MPPSAGLLWASARGGSRGAVFFPVMGAPVKLHPEHGSQHCLCDADPPQRPPLLPFFLKEASCVPFVTEFYWTSPGSFRACPPPFPLAWTLSLLVPSACLSLTPLAPPDQPPFPAGPQRLRLPFGSPPEDSPAHVPAFCVLAGAACAGVCLSPWIMGFKGREAYFSGSTALCRVVVSVPCWNAGAWDMAGFLRCASGSLCRLPGSQNRLGSVPLACSFH